MLILLFFLLLLLNLAVADPKKTTENPNATTQVQKQLAVTHKNITNPTKNIDSVGETLDSTDSTTEVTTVESLNSTIGTCDTNDTDCTGVNATSVSPIKNDTWKKNKTNEENKNHARHKIKTNINICACNLQIHFCDINCCCDPDCSSSDKMIFGYCEIDENRFYDARYCNYIKYIYINNTPFEWEVNQDGLFCIISSNVPDMYLIQNEEPIKSIDNFKLENHFWNQENTFLERSSQFGLKNYGFGDSIMIIRDDSSTDTFRLPRSFIGSPCIFEEDVYYLKDVKNSCSQMTIDDGNSNLNFSTFFKNFKIVRSPKLFNITKLKNNIYKNCPKNICLEIEPQLCDIHLTNCINVEKNTSLAFHCSYDLKKHLNTCLNAVKKIHYKFYHNGTSGVSKVAVLGELRNFTYHFGGKDLEFFQDFSVEFAWINQKIKNYSEIFSGNPGYLTGKPVLLGTKRDNGNTSFVMRNSPSFLENFLAFPANVEGSCVRNATFNIPIEFEYNMIAQCKLYRKFSFNNNQNATDICRSIQKEIFELWGLKIIENNDSLVIGLYGNANASTILDWSSVLYRIDPKTYLNNTQGAFTNSNKTLVCRNISSLIDVDVIYSRIDLQTVLNQQKVLGVSFTFGDVRDYSLSLNKQNGSVSFDLELSLVSQVSFYDVTGDKTRKFVDAPSFDIRLPYDFFYPFIRVGNGVSLVTPNSFVITLILYWTLFLI